MFAFDKMNAAQLAALQVLRDLLVEQSDELDAARAARGATQRESWKTMRAQKSAGGTD